MTNMFPDQHERPRGTMLNASMLLQMRISYAYCHQLIIATEMLYDSSIDHERHLRVQLPLSSVKSKIFKCWSLIQKRNRVKPLLRSLPNFRKVLNTALKMSD